MQVNDCGLAKITRYHEAAVFDSALMPEAKCPQNCCWCGRCGGGRLVSSLLITPHHHIIPPLTLTTHHPVADPAITSGAPHCSARTCHLAEEKLSSQSCPRKVVSSGVLTLPGAERGRWTGRIERPHRSLHSSLGPNPPLPSYITHTNQTRAIA